MNNPYLTAVNYLVSRALSMLNRNSMSATHGCFDRNFWHFKTIIDFPSATYQQVVLGMSKLFVTKREGNIYYQQPIIGEAVKAGILYWKKIQKKDGSFDEYYENERSFCATAFTTYAVAQAYFLIQDLFNPDEKKIIEKALLKSGYWLLKHKRPNVGNQMIASMNALYWVFRVTSDERINNGFTERRLEVLNSQNEEGWFPEYGGADIGYSFKALDLLSSYLEQADDQEIELSIRRLADFISEFLHPDGTCGGDYGSRCTQHVFPYGIEFLVKKNIPAAKALSSWFLNNLNAGRVIHPATIDDKYALYFYFNSYILAFLIHNGDYKMSGLDVVKWPEFKVFKSAGLARLNLDPVKAWFSIRRNGVCRVFYKNRLAYADCGYIIRLSNGKICATQSDNDASSYEYSKTLNETYFQVQGVAQQIEDSLPLTKWLVLFKLCCKTILKFNYLAYWFSNKIKTDKIIKKYDAPIKIKRNFILNKQKLVIKDEIVVTSNKYRIEQVKLIRDVTVPHSPSSRYYQTQFLLPQHPARAKEESRAIYKYEYEITFNE